MEANELRIGNFLSVPESVKKDFWECSGISMNEEHFVVAKIDNTELNLFVEDEEHEFDYKEVEPIELTKEWLERFGFVENRPWTFKYDDGKSFTTTLDGFTLETGGEGFRLEWCDDMLCIEFYYHYEPIKTVHRLQNVYFVLTGKELELKG